MAFGKLAQRTTPDAVIAVIREAILTGELPAGSQLREQHIAQDMGISRAPLREALSRLEEEGLVVKIPFRGAFVAEVSSTTVTEIATLRIRLEPFAVERSLPALLGPAKSEMAAALARLDEATAAGDVAASIDAHLAVHRLFYVHADHAMLLSLWNGWETQLRLFLAADHSKVGHLGRIAHDHKHLQDILKSRDMDRINEELSTHILGGFIHGHRPGDPDALEVAPAKPRRRATAATARRTTTSKRGQEL